MGIAYMDFSARRTRNGRNIISDKYNSLDDALAQANAWIVEKRADVINVETVVAPFDEDSDGVPESKSTQSGVGESGGTFFQVIRVWYKA